MQKMASSPPYVSGKTRAMTGSLNRTSFAHWARSGLGDSRSTIATLNVRMSGATSSDTELGLTWLAEAGGRTMCSSSRIGNTVER
jgi:hypothetical protein